MSSDLLLLNVMKKGTSNFYATTDGKVKKAYFVDPDREPARTWIDAPQEPFDKELAFWLQWEKRPTFSCRIKKVEPEKMQISTGDIFGDVIRAFKLKDSVKVAESTEGLKDKQLTPGAEVVLKFDPETMKVVEIRIQKYEPEKAEANK